MFERKTMYDAAAGQLNDAAWIADLESLIYLEGGAAIQEADFPNGCPSGTICHIEQGVVKAGSSTVYPTGLTRYGYDPKRRGVGSSGTMAIVVGGVVHVDKLPAMPAMGELPSTFVRQNDSGKSYTGVST